MKITLAEQFAEVRHQLDEFERWEHTLAGFGCGIAEAPVRLCKAMETLDAMLRGPLRVRDLRVEYRQQGRGQDTRSRRQGSRWSDAHSDHGRRIPKQREEGSHRRRTLTAARQRLRPRRQALPKGRARRASMSLAHWRRKPS